MGHSILGCLDHLCTWLQGRQKGLLKDYSLHIRNNYIRTYVQVSHGKLEYNTPILTHVHTVVQVTHYVCAVWKYRNFTLVAYTAAMCVYIVVSRELHSSDRIGRQGKKDQRPSSNLGPMLYCGVSATRNIDPRDPLSPIALKYCVSTYVGT